MKNISSVLVGIISALLFFGLGFFARDIIESPSAEKGVEKESLNISGVYECGDGAWNGKRETMVIFDDGTYTPPSGKRGTWEQIDDKTIQFRIEASDIQITGYIAETGITYSGTFFEKK